MILNRWHVDFLANEDECPLGFGVCVVPSHLGLIHKLRRNVTQTLTTLQELPELFQTPFPNKRLAPGDIRQAG